jgi:hypothetical protein
MNGNKIFTPMHKDEFYHFTPQKVFLRKKPKEEDIFVINKSDESEI